jgi:hypothetical protein
MSILKLIDRFQHRDEQNDRLFAGGDKPRPYHKGWPIRRRGGLYARPLLREVIHRAPAEARARVFRLCDYVKCE